MNARNVASHACYVYLPGCSPKNVTAVLFSTLIGLELLLVCFTDASVAEGAAPRAFASLHLTRHGEYAAIVSRTGDAQSALSTSTFEYRYPPPTHTHTRTPSASPPDGIGISNVCEFVPRCRQPCDRSPHLCCRPLSLTPRDTAHAINRHTERAPRRYRCRCGLPLGSCSSTVTGEYAAGAQQGCSWATLRMQTCCERPHSL